jgi:N-acetylglucosaminyl-diphospho-decaprenol L-rhamnosyltransferase
MSFGTRYEQQITVSVVTHGHGDQVLRLVDSLLAFPEVSCIAFTCNAPESISFEGIDSDRLLLMHNKTPQGFGSNHNAAFRHCKTPYFCVLNPDLELPENPFEQLIDLIELRKADLVAPMVLSTSKDIEDSVRHFPTLKTLFIKLLKGSDGRYLIHREQQPFSPDWVAGMFMLFRSSAYKQLCGFDERFYLYYEDVDICWRAKHLGLVVLYCPQTYVVHSAQRASRRDLRHMRWHLASMFRYLFLSKRL